MTNNEHIVEAILDATLKLRQMEESLAFVLNALNVDIDIEKATDTAIVESVPITSLEGFTQLNLRLDEIEMAIHSLVPEVALASAQSILQYKNILQPTKKD